MICGMTYYQICWYFLVYSFGGWVVEVIFHAVTLGKVINRGFLNGPVCPVYGFGVISVFAMINTLQSSGYQMSDGMIFIFGVILATVVELTLLRLSPNYQFRPRPLLTVTDFRRPRLSWLDGRCVQGPGTYSPRHG